MTKLSWWSRVARGAALAAALGASASGCAAISAVSGARTPLEAYALTPLAGPATPRGSRHIVVETPNASGAIATDRILIKPSRLQAAYVAGARWVDSAPEMVQTLLVQSLQSSGAFRLVGRTTLGLLPDVTLLTEVRAFQAEAGPPDGPLYVVRVGLTLTLVREADGAVIATRSFERTTDADTVDPLVLAAAFDAATGMVLREAVDWIAATAGAGAGGAV